MSIILIMAGTYLEPLICIYFSSVFSFSALSPQASSQPALSSLPQRQYVAERKGKPHARPTDFDVPEADTQS